MFYLTRRIILIPVCLFSVFIQASSLDDFDVGKTKVSGTIMMDYGTLTGLGSQSESGGALFETEIRRARIVLENSLKNNWKAKLQVSIDEESSESKIGDAYFRYEGFNHAFLTLGKFKEPVGLENMTSSKNITFLERSMMSNAFSLGKNKGLMLSNSSDSMSWAVSLSDIDSDDEYNPYSIGGRITWSPSFQNNNALHLGVSTSFRDMDGESFEVEEGTEFNGSDLVTNMDKIDVNTMQVSGIEVAWLGGPASVQAEYMLAEVQAVYEASDVSLDGFYIQGSYFLNNDSRKYKSGRFSGVSPQSSAGAYELTSRYSVLNTQESSTGNEAKATTLGLNYYYSKYIRFMGNLLYTESSDAIDDGEAVIIRAQFSF